MLAKLVRRYWSNAVFFVVVVAAYAAINSTPIQQVPKLALVMIPAFVVGTALVPLLSRQQQKTSPPKSR
jgi:uncharacterized membrane protein